MIPMKAEYYYLIVLICYDSMYLYHMGIINNH